MSSGDWQADDYILSEADAGVSEDIAHFYFIQLVAGVTYLHGKGISHRGP